MRHLVPPIAAVLLLAVGCGEQPPADGRAPLVLRVGHFSNVTHAHGLIAHAFTRSGRGWFEERLGAGARVEWLVYNAGPSAMEAIFAEALDLTYVGPNPALNAYMKSKGEEIRIVAGATVGGGALVVPGDGRIREPADFRGRKIGTPQLGNTQDVACRSWLKAQGFEITQLGGDVTVVPTENPEQLALFKTGALDAVWTVEPWVSILETEAGGRIFLEESDAITTVLVARAAFAREKADWVRKFVAAHDELTRWIAANPAEAQRLVTDELKAETQRTISPELLQRAWQRLRFTSEISKEPLERFVESARAAGFLRETHDLGRLLESPR